MVCVMMTDLGTERGDGDQERGWFLEVTGCWGGLGGDKPLVVGPGKSYCQIAVILP